MEQAIARPGAPVSLASIANVHWSDGGALDMDRIAAALRAKGAALLIDATHGAGMMDLDVKRLDPDFLIFPTYKWVLGPYGRAFLYVAKRRQEGVPLEQTSYGRRGVAAERAPYFADLSYVDGARRFDMGERDHFISLEMAAVGMEMMAAWGQKAIEERCAMLTGAARGWARGRRRHPAATASARAAHPLRRLPRRHAGGLRGQPRPRRVPMRRRGWGGCASARMSTTTRRMWTASWRPSRG
jgi:selenocysteine lyase/cysteine desulfurase